jgi:hypothetical protein
MTIGGVSIILILGIFNLALIFFQVASGLRLLKVRFGVHKKTGILLMVGAIIHGALAMLVG